VHQQDIQSGIKDLIQRQGLGHRHSRLPWAHGLYKRRILVFSNPQGLGERLMTRMVTPSAQKINRYGHASMTTGMRMITLEDCP
jgi:hypothetical protein